MEQEPLVSIIIPVYKVEKFLDECVASVAAQTYANLEILLVDDGSPDVEQVCSSRTDGFHQSPTNATQTRR